MKTLITMKILITILGMALISLACYLCASFVCWDIKVYNWHWSARLIYALVSISSNYVWGSYMDRFGK